jgi:hypothetical protein
MASCWFLLCIFKRFEEASTPLNSLNVARYFGRHSCIILTKPLCRGPSRHAIHKPLPVARLPLRCKVKCVSFDHSFCMWHNLFRGRGFQQPVLPIAPESTIVNARRRSDNTAAETLADATRSLDRPIACV